jgi:23S rRNA (guanosine2251-2'-O)-methyltransferase
VRRERVSGRRERIYGRRPVAEAERGRRRVWRTWTREEVGDAELERLCGSADHQGVVAEVDAYPYAAPDSLLDSDAALVVALDQVQDPRNLGAICRAAEVAGAAGVIIPRHRVAQVTAAVCKASAGAVEHLAVARARNLADWLEGAKRSGAWIYGADPAAQARHWELDLGGRVVLVLGGEAGGLRPRIARACDVLAAIPQRGRVESLNVASAAAVLLFEALRQRAGSG